MRDDVAGPDGSALREGLGPTEPKRDLVERMLDEADLCRNDGADDIARLLVESAAEMQTLQVQAFAGLSVQAHLSDLVAELDEMVGWAYSQLHRVNYTKQEDALMLDSMKLRLLTRPLGA